MNRRYETRYKKAKEINSKIKSSCLGVMIVGSVAYSPEKVTKNSDLDMVILLDFGSVNFKKFYEKLGQKFEPKLAKYAKEKRMNNFSIVWDEDFEIGLHLWDITAFEKVINLKKTNKIFKRNNFSRNFISTSEYETFGSMKNKEIRVYKNPKKVSGGKILDFYVYYEDKEELYTGIQVHNLILNPIILYDKNKILKKGIKKLKQNLKEKIIKIYGKDKKISLVNPLPEKIKNKLDYKLKNKLDKIVN